MRFRFGISGVALAGLVVLTAGCGGPSGQNAAAAARGQANSAIRALYQRILNIRAGFTDGMAGQYWSCSPSGGHSELLYEASVIYLYPFNRSISGPGLRQAMMRQARADGWTFGRYSRGGLHYQMRKGGLLGGLSVSAAAPGSRYSRYTGSIDVAAPCFTAGSAGSGLSEQTPTYPLPMPSPLPSGWLKSR